MARGKNGRSKGPAPEGWQAPVEASAEQDELVGTGVVMDEDGPVRMVKLSADEKALAGEHLAQANIELRALEQEQKDSASAFRKKVKAAKKAIADLSDDTATGVRREAAQATLPGTVQ